MSRFAEQRASQLFAAVLIMGLLSGLEVGAQTATTRATPGDTIPRDMKLVGGIKSYNTSGRSTDYGNRSTKAGPTFKTKEELFVGFNTNSGWGATVMMVQTASRYADFSRDSDYPSDPSLTLVHPALYEDLRLRIGGQFRQYFPVSKSSKKNNTYQHAYYSTLDYQMEGGVDVKNILTPRFFSRSSYDRGTTQFYVEDYTTVSRKVGASFRYGLGQHSQVEYHSGTPAGTVVDIYPYADYHISKNIYLGPRIYFPVYVDGSVTDAAAGADDKQIQAELYFQATL